MPEAKMCCFSLTDIGASKAMGLLYMQTSPGKTERVKDGETTQEWLKDIAGWQEFRDKLQKVIGDKHEDAAGQV